MSFGEHLMMMGGGSDNQLSQSCRFDPARSTYLSRTPSVAGNRKTWTWSGWVKRGNLGTSQTIFSAHIDSQNRFVLRFEAGNSLRFFSLRSNTLDWNYVTSALFRDPSAWYHIVLSLDTDNATAGNRVELSVNGKKITDFSSSTNPPQGYITTLVNYTDLHEIAKDSRNTSSSDFDGYLAEINFVDGTALDASSFGEWSEGTWVPKRYTGDRGTNGFYLDFGNSGSLGADLSGNSNNWMPTNLAATDQMLDSPTNNFATWNPITNITQSLSEGNLKGTAASSGNNSKGNFHQSSGKWYYEALWVSGSLSSDSFGITQTGGDATTTRYLADGRIRVEGVYTDTGLTTFTSGDVIGVAYDLDSNTVSFYKNNTLISTKTITINEGMQPLSYAGGARSQVANFGQDSSFAGNKTAQGNTDANGRGDFYYQPPAGYLALCTANLPEPEVSAQDHFNTVLYTGNASADRDISVGFASDFVWIKRRSSEDSHHIYDSVRGIYKDLRSDNTNDEKTDTTGLTDFITDGFTLGLGSNVNESGTTYAAWNWKAGGAGVPNNDGVKQTTVSANTSAGFSIVSYLENGDWGSSNGHGLSKTPELYICKGREATSSWWVFFNVRGKWERMLLDQTKAAVDAPSNQYVVTNDKTFLPSGYMGVQDAVAYLWHSVEGYSKIGSYTGNGSTDGPFVYCGFRPAFLMIKRADATENWHMQDSTRSSYNWESATVYANLSNAEYTGTAFEQDYLSNGFKLRTSNAGFNTSGGTYIFMAFAEMPFKYSTAR